MANNIHKGSEFKNITDTWDENEKKRASGNIPADEATPATALEQVIKQEAAEYDNENTEDRLLSGDRASLNDDVPANAPDA